MIENPLNIIYNKLTGFNILKFSLRKKKKKHEDTYLKFNFQIILLF